MRGTIIMIAGIVIILLGAGLYIFGSTDSPDAPPSFSCDLSRLRFSAFWEPATGALAGALTAENDSVRPCRIEGSPDITLRKENGEVLPTRPFRFQMEASPLTLNRGARSMAGFVWRNWCGPEPDSPLYIEVKLPNYEETFSVPVFDPDGTPSTRTPRCDAAEEQSELATGVFVEEGASLYSEDEE